MENTDNPFRQKWSVYVIGVVQALLGDLPARLWKIPLLLSHLLVLTLIFMAFYWLYPGPKKIGFPKYAVIVLLLMSLVAVVLWGIPVLLSRYISEGWAFGLTWFVFLQGLYWFFYYKNPRNRKLTLGVCWFLLSLVVAGIPIWITSHTKLQLWSLTR